MPRDVQGNTQPLPGTIVSTGDTILPSQHNPAMVDLYAMMAQSLSRDGQGGMRAPLDMSGFTVRNMGAGALPGDAVSVSQFQTGTPIGAVVDFAGSTAPPTWAMCYGQAVSRADYPDLFASIGVTFGTGDGSTTFNLPDLRGRVIAGKDDMGGANAGRLAVLFGTLATTLGGVFGSALHILTIGEIPSHGHTVNDPGHGHNIDQQFRTAGGATSFGGGAGNMGLAVPFALTNTTGISINANGGGGAHNNTQPTMIMNKIIKVSY